MLRGASYLTLPALCAATALAPSCAEKPMARAVRDDETRQVATRCGLYEAAVAKDTVMTRSLGHRVMTVDRNAFPRGSPSWRCLEREARKIGYELTYTWVMS